MAIRLHREDPRLFLEAIRFTAAETGFIPRLIEKDYFCSVVLEDLATLNSPLTFKGGTLLAKVHSGFYRLSEDLDFSISMPPGSTKKSRSEAMAPLKTALNSLTDRLPELRIETALTGSNGSMQYNAIVSYPSALADQRETIKVEIGLRRDHDADPQWTITHAASESGARRSAHPCIPDRQLVVSGSDGRKAAGRAMPA